MQPTTIGRHLINEALTDAYHLPDDAILDSKTADELYSRIARENPEAYADITSKLLRVATDAQGQRGGVSPNIRHLKESETWRKQRQQLQQEIRNVYADPQLSVKQKQEWVTDRLSKLSPQLTKDVFAEADAKVNPFTAIVKSGMKGKPSNVNNLLGSPLLFADPKNRVIPIPVLHGYASGLRPSEYWAASYGIRKSLVDTKLAVGKGGFLSKQMVQIAHRGVVTADDDDEDQDPNIPRAVRGLPVDTDDDDNIGALLAHDAGKYKRNTVITAKVLRDLKKEKVDRILVRSPTVGGPQDGGVYAKDVGVRENGRLAVRGENPGVTAVLALSEPISQGLVSSKHCWTKGTRVVMSDGRTGKAIEEIQPGDWVLGVDKDLNPKPVRVVQVFDTGLQECVSWQFQERCYGFAVTCTPEHRFCTPRGWIGYLLGMEKYVNTPIWRASKVMMTEGRVAKLMGSHSVGKQQTYDLEIDSEEHWYVTGFGLISHNSAGVVGSTAGAAAGGFAPINQFIQVPKESNDWAAHASEDGAIQKIEKAPQGGHYIYINNKPMYAPQGQNILHKPGQVVEAGDVLSDGLPNPSVVVEHKGIGEGRRYFTSEFTKLLRQNGMPAHRRNVELFARGLVNHVELDEEMDDYVQGDSVPYNMLEKYYQPRKDAQTMAAGNAVGKYLEKPILHYTIGTKIRPSVVNELKRFGLDNELTVHDSPPPFHAKMVRGMAVAASDPDWLASMQGTGIKARLLDAARYGHSSNLKGTSYVAGIVGDPNFATRGSTGKIQAPVFQLAQMQKNKEAIPQNMFDDSGNEDDDGN